LVGVFTALAIFPPRVTEIQEQEKDALEPILNISQDNKVDQKSIYEQPVLTGS
jgi:hypothetical protein